MSENSIQQKNNFVHRNERPNINAQLIGNKNIDETAIIINNIVHSPTSSKSPLIEADSPINIITQVSNPMKSLNNVNNVINDNVNNVINDNINNVINDNVTKSLITQIKSPTIEIEDNHRRPLSKIDINSISKIQEENSFKRNNENIMMRTVSPASVKSTTTPNSVRVTPNQTKILSPLTKPTTVTPIKKTSIVVNRTRNVVSPLSVTKPEQIVKLSDRLTPTATTPISSNIPISSIKTNTVYNEVEDYIEEKTNIAPSPPIRVNKRRVFSPLIKEEVANEEIKNEIPQYTMPETIAPQGIAIPPSTQVLTAPPARPNYNAMSEEEQNSYMIEFDVKLNILRRNFPEHQFASYPENSNLDARHNIYAGYVKQIVITSNCSQYELFLLIMFLALEAFGVKVLRLNMGGFTKLQMRTMSRYNSVLIELGEKYYVGGPSSYPPELRLIFMGITSAITFVVIKFLADYLGEASMGPLQEAIEQMLVGGLASVNSSNLPSNIPPPPTSIPMATNATQSTSIPTNTAPVAVPQTNPPTGGGFDIMSMINTFTGGTDIKETLVKLSSNFINATSKPASEAIQNNSEPAGSRPRQRPRFRAPTNATT